MSKKSVGMGVLVWFLTGGVGGHFVYGKDEWHYLLWFWLLNLATFGIAGLVSVIFISRWVDEHNAKVDQQELERMVMIKEVLK